jgi:hypothetical protein
MPKIVDEENLPLFKAKTIETDSIKEGQLVEGDFIFTRPWENGHGLKIAAGYEIWTREDTNDFNYQVDPTTLEISFDAGKTFIKYNRIKERYEKISN